MADGADVLVGLAQLIAEANGLAGQAHIKEKISEMIIHATVVRACYEAAIAHSVDRRVRRRLPERAVHERRQVHRRGELQPDGPPPPRHRRRRHRHGPVDLRPRERRGRAPRPQVHVDDERRRRRVPHPAVPRHPRPHRRLLRRLEPGHQHPGRRRALRPAHRDPQALRPRRRQAGRAGRAPASPRSEHH